MTSALTAATSPDRTKTERADLFEWLAMVATAHDGPPSGHEDALRAARILSPRRGQLNMREWRRFLLFCVHVATTQGRHGVGMYASNRTTAEDFGIDPTTANRLLALADALGYFVRETEPSRYGTVNRRIGVPAGGSTPDELPSVPHALPLLGPSSAGYNEPPF